MNAVSGLKKMGVYALDLYAHSAGDGVGGSDGGDGGSGDDGDDGSGDGGGKGG